MPIDKDVSTVQRLYPLLYVACHTMHGREKQRAGPLSARECAVLSHLYAEPALSAGKLAGHLGIARSTLSEIVARLLGMRYLRSHRDAHDERRKRLVVTEAGLAALSSVSVLDEMKVAAVLSRLTARERAKVIEGFALVAKAAAFRPARRPPEVAAP